MPSSQTLGVFGVFLFLTIAAVALFSFEAVAKWATERRREREAYYKNETVRRIAEAQGAGQTAAVEFLREQEKIEARHRRESQKLGGLITAAVGVGMMVFLAAVTRDEREPVYLAGLIPLLIGMALLGYAYLLAPKE